ncbi:MAG: cell division protein FtsZ [Candidatus Daviesbacteria bacterium]|nr:cell division protein FtsZ [Candidatus Daviesbacteria bacterium]
MLIKPDVQRFAKIKVMGLGGGGSNSLNSMISLQQIQGVEFVAVNTDAQALMNNQSPSKVQIGETLTKGLGSGGDPEVGRQASEESTQKLQDVLQDADMVFLTAGMGGGTGTGSIPIVASVARAIGALTVAVVTKPFAFEGTRRMLVAEEGLEKLRDKVDALIVIPNQRLLETVDKNMTLQEAFKLADSVLGQGVQGISDLITMPGLINVDFADVKTIMSNAGSALMGIGVAGGENRAAAAARMAIASPLLEVSIEGAKGVLFNIVGGSDLSMTEVNEAAQIIAQAADPDANIIFGATIKEDQLDQIKISVIATGFDETRRRLREYIGNGIGSASVQQGASWTNPNPPADDFPTPQAVAEEGVVEEEQKAEENDEDLEIPAFLRSNR